MRSRIVIELWWLPTTGVRSPTSWIHEWSGGFQSTILALDAPSSWAPPNATEACIVALNNDIVLESPCVQACLSAFANQAVGVVAPTLVYGDGTTQSGPGHFSRILRQPKICRTTTTSGRDACEWVTGAVFFVRATAFTEVGMDGTFFLGYEDADFCWRAGQLGWQVLCLANSRATHYESTTITGPRWTYYSARNRVWFARKHFGLFKASLVWLLAFSKIPRVLVADAVKRRNLTTTKLRILALRDALRKQPAIDEGPWAREPVPSTVMDW